MLNVIVLRVIMLNVIILNVIMLNVIKLNVITVNFIILNVIMLNVAMLNIVMLRVIMLNVITVNVVMLIVAAQGLKFINWDFDRKMTVRIFLNSRHHPISKGQQLEDSDIESENKFFKNLTILSISLSFFLGVKQPSLPLSKGLV